MWRNLIDTEITKRGVEEVTDMTPLIEEGLLTQQPREDTIDTQANLQEDSIRRNITET